MRRADRSRTDAVRRVALAVGFLALAVGTLVARRRPATDFEVSLYAGTPAVFWAGFALALVLALGVGLGAEGRTRAVALVLGTLAVTTFVILPLVRGYRYMGAGDSLSHLGYVGELSAGVLEPVGMFYPGLHTAALQIALVTGMPAERALLLTTAATVVAFLLFVPLAVRALVGDRAGLVAGAASAWLVLPPNAIATHTFPHPTSQAIMLSSLALFAFVVYLTRTSTGRVGTRGTQPAIRPGVSSYGVVLVLAAVATLLYHPMHAANLLLLFAATAAVQFVVRRRRAGTPLARAIGSHRPMYAQTALLGVLFVIWVAGRDRFQGALVGVVEDLFVAGSGSGAQVAQRGTSLAAFGSGLPELFVKLFLVTALYAALAGGVVLLSTRGRLGLPADSRAVVTYLAAGFFPLTGLFVAYYLGSPTLAFRQLGFAAVVLSVLGAVGIHALLAGAGTRPAGTRRAVRAGVAVILVVGLVLSLATVFPSPYVYKTSQHVTDQHLSGYETAFDHRADDVPYVGVDTGWDRFGDAVYGPAASSDIDYVRGSVETSVVEPAAFNGGDVASLYDDTRYMPLTDAAEVREVAVYDELYYTASGFESLDSQPRLDRVQSNGDFRLYVVRGSAAA